MKSLGSGPGRTSTARAFCAGDCSLCTAGRGAKSSRWADANWCGDTRLSSLRSDSRLDDGIGRGAGSATRMARIACARCAAALGDRGITSGETAAIGHASPLRRMTAIVPFIRISIHGSFAIGCR